MRGYPLPAARPGPYCSMVVAGYCSSSGYTTRCGRGGCRAGSSKPASRPLRLAGERSARNSASTRSSSTWPPSTGYHRGHRRPPATCTFSPGASLPRPKSGSIRPNSALGHGSHRLGSLACYPPHRTSRRRRRHRSGHRLPRRRLPALAETLVTAHQERLRDVAAAFHAVAEVRAAGPRATPRRTGPDRTCHGPLPPPRRLAGMGQRRLHQPRKPSPRQEIILILTVNGRALTRARWRSRRGPTSLRRYLSPARTSRLSRDNG